MCVAFATGMEFIVFLVMTLVVAMSFFLIADIDSPPGGIIRAAAKSCESLPVAPTAVACCSMAGAFPATTSVLSLHRCRVAILMLQKFHAASASFTSVQTLFPL